MARLGFSTEQLIQMASGRPVTAERVEAIKARWRKEHPELVQILEGGPSQVELIKESEK